MSERAKVLIACVGGFLGAGKTTALVRAARELMRRGLRVGVITNDQGDALVDTEVMRGFGLPTEEITGGCFCCKFDELVDHAQRLLDQAQPDVILAEAVGSCADLSATVYQPLRRYYADQFDLAPLSIFVEPSRLRAFAGGDAEGIVNLRMPACCRPDFAAYSADACRCFSLPPPSLPFRDH